MSKRLMAEHQETRFRVWLALSVHPSFIFWTEFRETTLSNSVNPSRLGLELGQILQPCHLVTALTLYPHPLRSTQQSTRSEGIAVSSSIGRRPHPLGEHVQLASTALWRGHCSTHDASSFNTTTWNAQSAPTSLSRTHGPIG